MDKYLEYMGSTYNLEDPLAINHLKIQADVKGMTFPEFLKYARNAEQEEIRRQLKFADDVNNDNPNANPYNYRATGRENLKFRVGDLSEKSIEELSTGSMEMLPPPPDLPEPGLQSDVDIPPAPPADTPAASDENIFDEAMMQYYRAKDAKSGTKLAEWAGNFETLAKRNYENQLRRNPELANPGQAFKDNWVSEAFGQKILASNAQLPDFKPNSTNLNYSIGDEFSELAIPDNAYTDFSRNNINPGEVTAESELKDFDFSELIKEFDYRKLL